MRSRGTGSASAVVEETWKRAIQRALWMRSRLSPAYSPFWWRGQHCFRGAGKSVRKRYWRGRPIWWTYAYGFPNLPVIWGYQTHKDEIDQAAERFYRCVKSYMVMRELVSRKRMKAYERIWRQAHFVHEKCTFEGQMTCAIARDLLSQAYLNDFLKS
ncbi:hypothetical protein ACLBYN_26280 [Pseudomonas aeruginosa]